MSSFCTAKATHIFFSKKFQYICVSLDLNFNESLTNDVVSFEQPGPEHYKERRSQQHCDLFRVTVEENFFFYKETAKNTKNMPYLTDAHVSMNLRYLQWCGTCMGDFSLLVSSMVYDCYQSWLNISRNDTISWNKSSELTYHYSSISYVMLDFFVLCVTLSNFHHNLFSLVNHQMPSFWFKINNLIVFFIHSLAYSIKFVT